MKLTEQRLREIIQEEIFGLRESKLNESMIGIKTKANFKPNQLKGALEKAKIKGFQMNRLSVTLTALKLDKKYYKEAMKIIDDLGLAVMMAKESKLHEDAMLTFSNELNDEGIVAGIFDATGDGKSVDAQFTKKKWDDGVPVTKHLTRGGTKSIKTPKGKFQIIETPTFWYYEINNGWAAVNKKDYGTPPFEY